MDASEDTSEDTGRSSTTGAPRWVKVFGLVVAALVVLMIILQLTGIGGHHGPSRHLHSQAPLSQPRLGGGLP